MKRSLIVVQQQPYDWEAAKQHTGSIAEHFSAYLADFRSKRASTSKHAVLGPVGKLLNKAAAGERNLESLLGYTLRIHEMSSKRSYLSPAGLEHLRSGAAELLTLLDTAPLAARDRILAQVDDGVYYLRRKDLFEFLEGRRQDFIDFLRNKYAGDEAQFMSAWGKDAVAFGEVRYPSSNQQKSAKSETKSADIQAFLDSLKEKPELEEEEMP
jgi:hypothetical protein